MNRWLKYLLALLIVVVLAAAIYLPYRAEHNKNVKLQGQIASLNALLVLPKQQNVITKPATQSTEDTAYMSKNGIRVKVYSPKSGATVLSPLAVVGEVPGNWASEAQFPVLLMDSAGNTVANGTAQLLGDSTTTSLVPFSVQLTYSTKPTGKGTLVLQKDNASGQSGKNDSVSIPVQF